MGAADSGITGISLYTVAAERAAAEVIDTYSTSFGAAARLLGKRVRKDVRNIYALVRVADEIVDGAAAQAFGVDAAAIGDDVAVNEALLDELENETYAAIDRGFSTNLVVHAFAGTALRAGIGREMIEPFFTSMRMDLHQHQHDAESLETYIYGSAEVVGLMCLQVFVANGNYDSRQTSQLVEGARALGSAFQKVNFLRDLAADLEQLGRSYFPGVTASTFDEVTKRRLVAEIEGELAISARSLRLLPSDCRTAVAAAHLLFEALNRRIANTPAVTVARSRISVGNFAKLGLLLRAYLGIFPRG
ncbi:MAG: hypothetical protein RL672_892 [Actinomycetota bacterium]|jgi:phytoene/squalene synthetase